jgi:predicted butyrate kinase (DUF1464 family)
MRFAGIDPGTASYEIFILENEKPFKKIEVSTAEVRENPEKFREILAKIEADLIAGLSGYGMPIRRFSELTEKDVFLLTLNTDPKATMGMRMLIEIAKELDLNIYTIPGVIHLPTVPEYRKINRIDLGTADKLCSAILGIKQLNESPNFLLVESGFGFNAFIAVRNGKIVDGLGGSSSFPAFSSLGAIDGELAYLLKPFPKEMLFSGGIRSYFKDKGMSIRKISDLPLEALQWFAEYLMKGIRAVEVSCKVERILLSGKNFSYAEFTKIFREMAEDFGYECERLKGFGIAKQSAEGAAVIANGLGGGKFKEIIEKAEILNARGTVLDYITSDIRKYLRI